MSLIMDTTLMIDKFGVEDNVSDKSVINGRPYIRADRQAGGERVSQRGNTQTCPPGALEIGNYFMDAASTIYTSLTRPATG